MAKATAKIGSKDNPLTGDILEKLEGPGQIITGAKLRDGFLDYSYKVVRGPNEGDTHNVKGSGIGRDSLLEAFNKFNVHMAVADEAFKLSGIEIQDIDKMHGHELTTKYTVIGFKIKGDEDNEQVMLIGSKYTEMGVMELETPKIAIDQLSSYQWHNELRTAVEQARNEVELYMKGNFDVPDKPEKTASGKQMTISDQMNDSDFQEAAR